MRYLALTLVLASAMASGHSLEPGRIHVRVVNGFTKFPLTAVNRFDHVETFVVEAFTDKTLANLAPIKSTPRRVTLGPNGKARVFIEADGLEGDEFYVCTTAQGDDNQLTFVTRVCTKVMLHHKRGSK